MKYNHCVNNLKINHMIINFLNSKKTTMGNINCCNYKKPNSIKKNTENNDTTIENLNQQEINQIVNIDDNKPPEIKKRYIVLKVIFYMIKDIGKSFL